jgi:nitrate reductase NapAB chaperone NapD
MEDLILVTLAEENELILRLSAISTVQKLDGVIYLSLIGEQKPLQIRGEAATAIWSIVQSASLRIKTGKLAQERKS